MKRVVLVLALSISTNVGATSLTWDAVPEDPPVDGYKLYCAPEPVPDLNVVEPIYTGVETVVPVDGIVPVDVEHRCWVTSYVGELQSPHSNYLVFTLTTSETIVLPAQPKALTITW